MHSKISELMRKINRVAARPSFPNISKLEIDLLMQHVRDLYDELSSLEGTENEKTSVPVQNQPVEEKTVSSDKVKSSDENILSEKEPERKQQTVIKEEPKVEKAEIKHKIAAKSSINEIIPSAESLNSKLKPASKEVHHKLSTKPMRELIDLNKRFVLINELFQGSAETFGSAIHQVDSLDDFIKAESFIRTELVTKYNWNESSRAANLFWELVKQKFGVGQQ